MAHAIPAPTPATRKPFYRSLYVQVLVAIGAGILLGHFYPALGADLKPLGDAFIKLVKMIIAPVIFLTVVTGIAGMRDLEKVGRVAGKAMVYFLTFSTLALIIGLVVGNRRAAGRGPEHRPGDARSQGGRRLCRKGARPDHRRLPHQHHPDNAGQRARVAATSCRCCSSRSCSASRWR